MSRLPFTSVFNHKTSLQHIRLPIQNPRFFLLKTYWNLPLLKFWNHDNTISVSVIQVKRLFLQVKLHTKQITRAAMLTYINPEQFPSNNHQTNLIICLSINCEKQQQSQQHAGVLIRAFQPARSTQPFRVTESSISLNWLGLRGKCHLCWVAGNNV